MTQRVIHYRKMCCRWESAGRMFGRCFIIPDHYHNAVDTYLSMAAIAIRDFPHLRFTDIECSIVDKSTWCKGMPIIEFSADPDAIPADYQTYPDCSNFLPA